jgi:carbonic anhydrase/acetyltransferase-like protein (isoleucine patch superfamily)
VDLAAVVIVPPAESSAASPEIRSYQQERAPNSPSLASLMTPILGNDILHAWIERIRKLGVPSLWLSSSRQEKLACSTLQAFASQGIQRFLTIKLKSYAEMDLGDLIHFHRESRNTVTEVHDSHGQLGVRVFDHPAAASGSCEYCAPVDAEHAAYPFHGYAKRVLSARERQDLVGDVLIGGCAIRPLGKEIDEQVWVGEGAKIADSVRLIGPSYIGAHTEIRSGATIGPFASIERECIVDYGTTVERSTLLPGTYLASGLLIRNALVDGRYLEDLNSGVIADLEPAGFTTRAASRRRASFSPVDANAWEVKASASAAEWRQVQL